MLLLTMLDAWPFASSELKKSELFELNEISKKLERLFYGFYEVRDDFSISDRHYVAACR